VSRGHEHGQKIGRGPNFIVIREQEYPCSASMLLLQVITVSQSRGHEHGQKIGRGPNFIVIREQEYPCSASMLLLQVITVSQI
jgi:hypothetical protein